MLLYFQVCSNSAYPQNLGERHTCDLSWAQIGRSAIFGREIGVPDREIFSRQKIFECNVKNCLFASP